MESMKIIALIPARSSSKRVRDKNIRNLGGWPLMRWSVEVAKQCSLFEKIIISSDSEVYLKMANEWGIEGILRPSELAQDGSGDHDVIKHAMLTCAFVSGEDLIVYLRPTTPFRSSILLGEAIQTLKNAGENATSLRSIEEMTESAFKCFTLNFGFLAPIADSMQEANLPNQLIKNTYRGNGYIDIIKPQQVLTGDLWGNRCIGFITPRVIEIDTEEDFRYAEWFLNHRRWSFGKEEI